MNGPFQALFIAIVGSRARTDNEVLMTNKIDSKNFAKFCLRLENFITDKMLLSSVSAEDLLRWRKRMVSGNSENAAAVIVSAIASDRFDVGTSNTPPWHPEACWKVPDEREGCNPLDSSSEHCCCWL